LFWNNFNLHRQIGLVEKSYTQGARPQREQAGRRATYCFGTISICIDKLD
jgi:hypothetical protein